MKYFSGTTQTNVPVTVCDEDDNCFLLEDSIPLEIDEGASEGGSSGAALLLGGSAGGRVVGILSARNGDCDDATAYFGELRHFYPDIEDWLDPDPPNPTDPIVSPGDDHGDSKSEATPVELVEEVDGNIGSSDDVDFFTFTVEVTGEIEIYTSGSLDTTGQLTNEDETVDVFDDDSGPSHNFSITAVVSPGTYYIEVAGYSGSTGDYTLHLDFIALDDHGDSIFSATKISSTAGTWQYSTPAHIDRSDDTDVFELELHRESVVDIYTNGDTDTSAVLTDNFELELATNDDADEDDKNFKLSETLSDADQYAFP